MIDIFVAVIKKGRCTLICLINVEGKINMECGKAVNAEGENLPMLLCLMNLEGQRLRSVEGEQLI